MTELRERRRSGAVSVKRALIGRPRAGCLVTRRCSRRSSRSQSSHRIHFRPSPMRRVGPSSFSSPPRRARRTSCLPISGAIAALPRDRRPFLPADGARLRDERWGVRRRTGQRQAVSEPPGCRLLVDYVLTVAVSVHAGVLASLRSPMLRAHKVSLSLLRCRPAPRQPQRSEGVEASLFALPTRTRSCAAMYAS